jgi:hypothetical protein
MKIRSALLSCYKWINGRIGRYVESNSRIFASFHCDYVRNGPSSSQVIHFIKYGLCHEALLLFEKVFGNSKLNMYRNVKINLAISGSLQCDICTMIRFTSAYLHPQ